MAINTLIENNYLVIDQGTANEIHFQASRTDMEFTDVAVILTDYTKNGNLGQSVTIAFTDFQYNSVAYSTKDTIFDILKDKIG